MGRYPSGGCADARELQQRRSRERGGFLYEMRVRENMTLKEAAGRIGIHKSTLCRYEQGAILRISQEVTGSICCTYHITEEELKNCCLQVTEEGREKSEPAAVSREDSAGEKRKEGRTGAKTEKRRLLENRLISDDEFLQIYKALDDVSKLRVQFMAGTVQRET